MLKELREGFIVTEPEKAFVDGLVALTNWKVFIRTLLGTILFLATYIGLIFLAG